MDIHLAGTMDGIETAIRIRRHYGIPIIFLTLYADEVAPGRIKNPVTKTDINYCTQQVRVRKIAPELIEIAVFSVSIPGILFPRLCRR